MNGYTFIAFIILILATSCIMPTIDSRLTELDNQANERVERLKAMGRK